MLSTAILYNNTFILEKLVHYKGIDNFPLYASQGTLLKYFPKSVAFFGDDLLMTWLDVAAYFLRIDSLTWLVNRLDLQNFPKVKMPIYHRHDFAEDDFNIFHLTLYPL